MALVQLVVVLTTQFEIIPGCRDGLSKVKGVFKSISKFLSALSLNKESSSIGTVSYLLKTEILVLEDSTF